MRLLVFTQKVDSEDSILGFFHNWISELSKKFESIEVICLGKGTFDLPANVTVYSLGKEKGVSRLRYLKNLYQYLYLIRGSYDAVFVHMNQEYVLLSGLYWKLKNIPVYLWRNHPRGNILTRIAVFLSTKIFCTSIGSFTARFKKTVIMPAGIDLNIFKSVSGAPRKKYSVCMVGRVSPIKHIELALEAVKKIVSSGGQISLSIIGNAPQRDIEYYAFLKRYVAENDLSNCVSFEEEIVQSKLSEVFSTHEICLNLTESGSFDKTIVEAAACGTVPLVSNTSFTSLLPEECLTLATPEAVAASLKGLFDPHQWLETQAKLDPFVQSQSLEALMEKLAVEIA